MNPITRLFLLAVLSLLSLAFSSSAFAVKRLAVLEFRGAGVEEHILSQITEDVRMGVLNGLNHLGTMRPRESGDTISY